TSRETSPQLFPCPVSHRRALSERLGTWQPTRRQQLALRWTRSASCRTQQTQWPMRSSLIRSDLGQPLAVAWPLVSNGPSFWAQPISFSPSNAAANNFVVEQRHAETTNHKTV